PDPKEQAANARHLSKYVFARQYGLSSPFSSTVEYGIGEASNKRAKWSNREEEIRLKGPCKTPQRVKPALDLLEKMIWRHGKCAYKALRDKACPSKVRRTILATGLTQAEKQVKQKPRFADFECNHHEVFRYVILVTKAVIPGPFWGSADNFKVVEANIKRFIAGRRYETFTLHNVIQNLNTSDCGWLQGSHGKPKKAKVKSGIALTDSLKQRELLEDFMFWFFDSFLLTLLKTTFHVTDSSVFRNKVLYFRHDDWETLSKPLVDRLTSSTFQRLDRHDAEQLLRQRRLGFSFVRLLPKETGVRPIVNLRRRQPAGPVRNFPSLLTNIQVNKPDLLGASVFGSNDIYPRLKAYKARLLENSAAGKLPQLYFVKVDVQACFDTIEQGRLLSILKHIVTEDAYMIQRYGHISKVGRKIRRMYKKKAIPEGTESLHLYARIERAHKAFVDEHPHFLAQAREMATAFKHTIFVDQVQYSYEKTHDILALLEEHVTENLVKIGNEYYRQMVGIPQGSILSAILCSFFYGDLERNHPGFHQDSNNLLMRLIDDYLFITTDVTKARAWLAMMTKGHPEYGCFISKDKTLANFDHGPDLASTVAPLQKAFPWCGYRIDMLSLAVNVDYSRFHERYLRDSLTVSYGRQPGVAFQQKMLQLVKHRSHIIFCDTDHNGLNTVYFNVYQNYLLAAMKMH
ncbi:hypothetical protein PUNSTDRAFT_20563, partial [Punctularia strigosozonata HHB-11173 SS5]|uniref:uncharacterized protein n=1 Tax=Punctularia strigosozonata (strain HHB-11173) TaxID=741275 RepID=UPI0004417D3D